MQPQPQVYIDGHRMEDYALSNEPVLAGLSVDYGTDSDLDFPAGDTLTFSLLVRETSFMDFLQLGAEVAVWCPPVDAGGVELTVFTGRIQRLSGDPHPTKKGALLIEVECSDLTADLAPLTVPAVNTAATPATARFSALRYWLPAPWSLAGWLRWPDLEHAAVIRTKANVLEMIDAFARSQILRRRNASTFTPAGGITRQLHLMEDSTKDTRADQLTYFEGSTRWGTIPGQPYGPDVSVINLDGSDFHAAAGWIKEPEDVITEVSLELLEDPVWDAEESRYEDSETFDYTSSDFSTLDTAGMKARYGHRQANFTTDLGRKTTSTHLLPIMRHWLSEASDWRPADLRMKTTANLTPTALHRLLAVNGRYSMFAVIRNVTPHRPDAGNQWIRGFIIGGTATWNGTEWELSFRLGRNPQVAGDAGDWWTLERLAASEFKDATSATVGNALSVRDFLRIGEPN